MDNECLINEDMRLSNYAFTSFKDILDSWIRGESTASFQGSASLQFNHGQQAFLAPAAVIERVGILVANSERFQGNRMLGNQAGLVEACRLTAIVNQQHLTIGPQRIELGMGAPGHETFPIVGGGDSYLSESSAKCERDTRERRAVTGLAPIDESIRKMTKIGRGNN